MTSRVGPCPSCVGGKVNLLTLQCLKCNTRWLNKASYEEKMRTSRGYLAQELSTDLDLLVIESQLSLMSLIKEEVLDTLKNLDEKADVADIGTRPRDRADGAYDTMTTFFSWLNVTNRVLKDTAEELSRKKHGDAT